MSGHKWHLRTFLMWSLTAVLAASFLVVGTLLFLIRLPQITHETQAELRFQAADLAQRSEVILGALQTQLELIAMAPQGGQGSADPVLRRAVADRSGFTAIYQVNRQGTVVRAEVTPKLGADRRREILGNDLSRDPLFLRTRDQQASIWSDKYLSPVSSTIAVGIGVPAGDDVLIGEVPLDYILQTLRAASGRPGLAVWVIDRNGEILADSEDSSRVGVVNLGNLSLLRNDSGEPAAAERLTFEGGEFEVAIAHSPLLKWRFLTRTPAGLANPRLGSTLDLGIAALLISAFIGLALAPLWATSMARPINSLAKIVRSIADGRSAGPWPLLGTVEMSGLAEDIERMATSLQERSNELETIFNASPVGIAVLDPGHDYAFIKANDAILQLLNLEREHLLGKTGRDINMWCDMAERQAFYATLARDQTAQCEAWIHRAGGANFLAALAVRNVVEAGGIRTILVARDITELRRIEGEIRTLNAELEQRVEQRTGELHRTNAELSKTIDHLQLTQNELVRSEKLASLGSLVAGIAHELNTPLGNGVMAVSTLASALRTFHQESAQGLKRSSLERLLETMDTGTDIAFRNLTRAAELVTSFKQVAADQTSSQRREFHLDEVVNEIILTLRPQLKRSEVEVSVAVADGLCLDSYPGPLGQVLTNLINNAVTHAFDGRHDGLIRLEAAAEGGQRVCITVNDNGCGIPASLLPRIFDPFVTTRMGRGGTGLGLHIVHNLVAQALGGSIRVDSQEGRGTTFTLSLPRTAPQAAAST